MLTRFALFVLLAIFVARALWRLIEGIVQGARGPSTPQRGVPMVRDPVCGTYVVPGRVTIADGRTTVSFCSEACKDKYRPSKRSGRRDPSTESGSPGAASKSEPVGGRATPS